MIPSVAPALPDLAPAPLGFRMRNATWDSINPNRPARLTRSTYSAPAPALYYTAGTAFCMVLFVIWHIGFWATREPRQGPRREWRGPGNCGSVPSGYLASFSSWIYIERGTLIWRASDSPSASSAPQAALTFSCGSCYCRMAIAYFLSPVGAI